MRNWWRPLGIVLLAVLSAWAVVGINLTPLGIKFERRDFRLGLDLQGGTHLVLQADLSKVADAGRGEAMNGVLSVMERRVNAYGVSEPVLQIQGNDRIIVELPGIKDIEQAKQLIGKTAKLEFRERGPDGSWIPATGPGNDGEPKELTGAYLVPDQQQVVFSSRSSLPEVTLQFNDEGAKLWEDITTRNLQKQVAIFLDNQPISQPVVQAVLSHNSVITGMRLDEAKLLAIQLNAGALPVPVTIQQERTVDATLGADSVQKSILAGWIALVIVGLFMTLYYRLPGVLATLALLLYSAVNLGLYKLVPVTLTLSGIAAFILSVGMAVDANILIFERMKEELRSGRTLGAAIDAGFDRAWPSIRDSNFSTLITTAILYYFGQTFGATLIMGFALTLAIGVLVSMFSAIFVTRSLLGLVVGRNWALRSWLFGMDLPASSLAPATREERGRAARLTSIRGA
ncbi:MAG: protein translocase subunit SecD [Chloroflexi bacterium]|nr:protein translocase subunit SecD [Chloroflexota bacterium]